MKKIIYLVSMLAFSASFSLSQTVTFGPVNELGNDTIPFIPPVIIPGPGSGPLPSGITCNGTYSLRMDDGSTGNSISHATSVWSNSHTIDLTSSFETKFRIRFGDVNNAADGITFTLHRDPDGLTALENGGGHLGVSNFVSGTTGPWGTGISPSINVEFDIFDNGVGNEDIDTTHVAISYDGELATPMIGPSAIELTDSTWHDVIIKWDVCTDSGLIVRLDGRIIAQLQDDIVNNVFGGNPSGIFFGFTSATQNENTTHDLCFISHEVIHCNCEDIDNPTILLFSPICALGQNCVGVTYTVDQSTTPSIMIDWGDGTVTTGATNTHIYPSGGAYTIRVIAQYHLLSDPMNCCIKTAEKTVRFRRTLDGEKGFPSQGLKSGMIKQSGSAFPNPVNKGESLTLNLPNGETGNISVYHVSGSKIMDVLNPSESKKLEILIPLSMNSGIYLIRFENKEMEPIKFIVE